MASNTILFIGGPLHGQFRSVSSPARPYLNAAKPLKSLCAIPFDLSESSLVEPSFELVTYLLQRYMLRGKQQLVYVTEGYELKRAMHVLVNRAELSITVDRLPAWITTNRWKLAEHLWIAGRVFQHNLAAIAELHHLPSRF